MSNVMIEYKEIDSPIHNLTGATKLICFMMWAFASMITYDTRLLLLMVIGSLIIFKISKVEFSQVSFVFYFILIFLMINNIAIFFITPYQGTEVYGTKTVLFHLFGPYSITTEQLFYQLNITMKYFSIIPMALLFMVSTNPSEFASSLNKIGVNYKVAYSVSLALRYVPDIQHDYKNISLSQQARGIELSKKGKLFSRIKGAASIIMPLILSSIERIDKISCAMELRAFGNKKKRTWYTSRKFSKNDYIAIILIAIVLILAIILLYVNGGRYFNPF